MKKDSIGKKIKDIRKLKKLTQFQLAEKAGMNEKHISKIETGVYYPTYTTLSKILKALNIEIDDFGFYTKNPEYENVYYIKCIEILNNAKSEQELEYYYGTLNQAHHGIEILKQ